jgi:hypothetical protein
MKPTSNIRFAVDGDRITTECQHDLASFLRAGLVAEPGVTRSLRQFARQRRNTGKDWRTVIETFAEVEGLGEAVWANTYDHANLLRPGARYLQFDSLVILQPHDGGTDARTDYGDPRCFRDEINWLYRHGEAVLAPEGGESVYWVTTDAGETWQAGGAYPDLHELQGSIDPADRGNGKVFVSTTGDGFSPLDGARLRLHLPFSQRVDFVIAPISSPLRVLNARQATSKPSGAYRPFPASPTRYRSI